MWGGVCDDGFNINEANVVCKQLGYHLGAKLVHKRAGNGNPGANILVESVSCIGEEKSVSDCKVELSSPGNNDCSPEEMVAVVCKEREETCENSEFHCASGECIALEHLCDGSSGGRDGCKDRSDEAQENRGCNLQTQVQLSPPGR